VIFQERLLKVLKCYNFLSATTTQLLSSRKFCKLRYDTIPVKSASANVSIPITLGLGVSGPPMQIYLSIAITQKCQILICDTLVTNGQYVMHRTFDGWHLSTYVPGEHMATHLLIYFIYLGSKDNYSILKTCCKIFYFPQNVIYFIILSFPVQTTHVFMFVTW